MKSILIVGFISGGPESDKLEKYRQEFAAATEAEVLGCFYDDILFRISPETFTGHDLKNGRELDSYDLVVLRGSVEKSYIANAICRLLDMRGTAYFNDFRQYGSPNKLLQSVEFFRLGLPFPATLFCAGNTHLLKELKGRAFPYIVKAVNGSKGNDNYLIRSESDLQGALGEQTKTAYIVQDYIPNDRDYRLLQIGEDMHVIERRGSEGSHLNNLSQGGTLRSVDPTALPTAALDHARQLAEHYKMVLAGSDVILSTETGKYYFLEINSQPGWRTLEAYVADSLKRLLASY